MGTRILQVANFYSRHSGGLRTTVDALGRAYVGAGFERVLVVPGPADADEDTPAGRRITLRSPKLPGSGGYRALAGTGAVRAVLAELPPDHLEVSDKLTLVGLGQWATRNGLPRRACLARAARRDPLAEGPAGLPAGRVRRLVEPPRRRRDFDAVVTPSRFAAVEFTRIGATDVSVVPLGVDLDVFNPHARERPAGADGDDNEVRLVCVGRLSREKRPAVAIEVLRAVRTRGVPARLWMVGDGPRRVALEEQAAACPSCSPGICRIAASSRAFSPAPTPPSRAVPVRDVRAGGAGGARLRHTRGGGRSRRRPRARAGGTGRGHRGSGRARPPSLAAAVHDVVRRPHNRARRASRDRAEQYPWARTACEMLRIHRAA